MTKILNFKISSFPKGVTSRPYGAGKFQVSRRNGFSLIFALLIMSVVASIGISVFEMSFVELMLTESVKESQSAFYAADTGMECVMYWDNLNLKPETAPMFSTSTTKNIKCNNQDITVGDNGWINDQDQFELLFFDDINNNGVQDPPDEKTTSCADITLTIKPDGSKKTESLGRSRYGEASCATSYPGRAERGIEANF